MAIVQNREWEIVTLPRLRAILLRPLILREALARGRLIDIPVGAMKLTRRTLFFLAFMQRVLVRAANKSPSRPTGARQQLLGSLVFPRGKIVMRGNYSRYNGGRSTLCIIVALRHEEKVYPVPSNVGRLQRPKREEGRVLEGPR